MFRPDPNSQQLANLAFVGKSYGGGALKVEPRQLDGLEIPVRVVQECGLVLPRAWEQMALLEGPAAAAARRLPR